MPAPCGHCGTPLPTQAQFCSGCGTSTGKKPRRSNSGQSAQRFQGSPEGQAKYVALIEAKTSRNARLRRMFRIVLLVLAGVFLAGATLVHSDDFIFPAVICGVLLLLSLLGSSKVRLTEAEYYTLPGSRDARGEHHCIKCGHPGIYRSSPYQTNHTHADCSKCRTALWQGMKGN